MALLTTVKTWKWCFRWLVPPTQVNAYYSPEFNQFGKTPQSSHPKISQLFICSFSCWDFEATIFCFKLSTVSISISSTNMCLYIQLSTVWRPRINNRSWAHSWLWRSRYNNHVYYLLWELNIQLVCSYNCMWPGMRKPGLCTHNTYSISLL